MCSIGFYPCRVAPSFVRFGTFQLPAMRAGGQEVLVKKVADYVLQNHMPHLLSPPEKEQPGEAPQLHAPKSRAPKSHASPPEHPRKGASW